MFQFFILIIGAVMFTTCSVSPEETPGLCSLTCGSAKIGGSDPTMKILANSPLPHSKKILEQARTTWPSRGSRK